MLSEQETHLQADSMMLVGVRGTVAAFLAAIWVTALSAADLCAAEWTAFTSFTLPVQPARRAAHFCTISYTYQVPHSKTQSTRLGWILK